MAEVQRTTANSAEMSQRFIELIMMLAEQSVMLLGLQPHPATGKTMRNLKAAKIYIDQIEMIREKTRGNLVPEEAKILTKMLGDLQFEYVRISGDLTAYDTSALTAPEDEEGAPESAPALTTSAGTAQPQPKPSPASVTASSPSTPTSPQQAEAERKVRFTKSYG